MKSFRDCTVAVAGPRSDTGGEPPDNSPRNTKKGITRHDDGDTEATRRGWVRTALSTSWVGFGLQLT
jgi:hypothetical protein